MAFTWNRTAPDRLRSTDLELMMAIDASSLTLSRAVAIALAGVVCGNSDVRAEDLTLTYQAVVHTTEWHALALEGKPGHEVGIAAFRGITIFDDGRIANHRYSGHFDFEERTGSFAGYALWVFEDGSTLEAAYSGEAIAAADGGITFTGTHTSITGTGEYAGATGNGRFEGRRVDHLEDGGDTWYRGELDLSIP